MQLASLADMGRGRPGDEETFLLLLVFIYFSNLIWLTMLLYVLIYSSVGRIVGVCSCESFTYESFTYGRVYILLTKVFTFTVLLLLGELNSGDVVCQLAIVIPCRYLGSHS